MNKSAMQELIDELDLTKIANRDKLVMVKYIIAKCLEKEKEQLEDAFYTTSELEYDSNYKNFEDFYNQTYNQNK